MLSSSSSSSSLASASPTTLYTLSSSRHNNGKIGLGSLLAPSNPITSLQDDNALIQGDTLVQQQDDEKSMDYNKSSSQCLSECNYSSSLSITEDLEIQCKQCFLWPRTQSLDPLKSDNSSTAKVGQDDKKDMPPPDILSSIPIRTSSSLDTAPFVIPQATTSAPLLSDNTSMAQTISTRFHFKRTPKKKSMIPVSSSSSIPTTAFSHHRTASATDDLGNTGKSNKFVRSLITRKVSFPAIFSSKKIHPTTSISSSPVQSNGVFI
ncbi:hypothetical protein BC941DRAFT_415381 [Chlamydoabsidia padenii]|nr:hypothetical protein BC941DRAFT_415381 [Chlamydoabsidia padenii]